MRTADRWIYIGESENVQQRLLEHVLAPDACLASHAPTSFGVELLHAEGRALRRAELLVEFAPVCR